MADPFAELRALVSESPSRPPTRSSFDELQQLIDAPSRVSPEPTGDELDVVARAPKLPPAFTLKPPAIPNPDTTPLARSRTGSLYRPTPEGAHLLDLPVEAGVAQAGAGAKHLVTGEGGRMNAASDIIEGSMQAATPAMIGGALANPILALRALVTGIGAQKATETAGPAVGLSPDATRLASNVAGLVVPGAVETGIHARPRIMERLRRPLEQPVVEPTPPISEVSPQPEVAPILDEGGRELGGYAGPERRVTPSGVPPEGLEERRLTPAEQVRKDLRDNPDLIRQADEMKQRAEAARHDNPIDELKDLVGEEHATATGEQPIGDLGEHLGTDTPREPAAVAQADRRNRPVERSEDFFYDREAEAARGAEGAEGATPAERAEAAARAPSHVSELDEAHLAEVRRIVHELDAMGYTSETWTDVTQEPGLNEGNAGGGHYMKRPRQAGAKVYDDIFQIAPGSSKASRGVVQDQLERFLSGKMKKPTQAVQGALEIARLRKEGAQRIPGDGPLSTPELPRNVGEMPTRLEPKPAETENGFTNPKENILDLAEEPAGVEDLGDWFKQQAAAESPVEHSPIEELKGLVSEEHAPAPAETPAANPIEELARAINEGPKVAEAPFSLTSESADRGEVQSDLFKSEKPTFGGRGRYALPAEEKGTTLQSTVLPGVKEFAEKDVGPALKAAGETITRAADDIQRTFAAGSRGDAAKITAGIIRARSAELAHRTARAGEALKAFGRMFDRKPAEQNFKFIDDIEHGQKTDVAELAPVQKALRAMLDGRRREVRARGRLNQVIADYFPHIWKDPNQAQSWLRSLFGRRPLQGPKSFLKKRSIGTTAEGRARGLVPVSNNPVTLTLLKVREMDKWITGHDALEDMKANGVAKYVPVGTEAPEGWVRINDPIGTVYGNPNVPVHEAFDESLFKGLNQLAEDLGVKHERSTRLKGGPRGAWGLSHEGQSKIQTRTGGPEQVIAHEIGHQMDDKFGLWRRIHKDAEGYKAQGYEGWNVNKELRALTDLTWEGKEVPDSFKKYVRKKEEKIANMVEAYVHAPTEFKRVAPNIFNVFDELVDTTPVLQQLRDIKPSMRLSAREDSTRIGGMVVNGHWWAPAEGAHVLNQHLSPGLAGNALFDVYRGTGNLVTQAKFALSAFHALFEASESVLSKAALSMQYVTPRRLGGAGMPLEGAKKAGEIVVAPFVDYFRGAKALREYFTKDPVGSVESSMVDTIIQGGGRVKWDDFYKSNMAKGFVDAAREGNYPGAIIRAPFAAMEALAHPIMGHLVPRLKVGAYLDLARYELRKLPAEASQTDVQAALGRAWDSIDNRFGELVYDNLFWPRWVKDAGQVTFRALGWNAGTVREVGGAAIDTGKYAKALLSGKQPDMTPKMAYGLALAGVGVLMQGTVMQYLMTGEKPRDVKDMIFPRTGRKTPSGHDERLKLWTYAGDLYEVAHHPGSTFKNKLHDMLTGLTELAENRDWKGVQVRDPEAPLGEQAKQVGKYALEKVEPISMSNARRASETGRSGLGSFLGVGTAPAWLSQSPAEQMIYGFTKSEDTRTLKQEANRQKRQELRQAIQDGDAERAKEIKQSGELGRRSILATARTARLTALQAGFKKLTLDQAIKVYETATPAERAQLRPLLVHKGKLLRNAAPDDRLQLRDRYRRSRELPVGPPAFALQPNP
jgi:hypothetical protein